MIFLSFLGMGLVWGINYLGIIEFSVVGLFFIMIAIVTLPHMFLIERVYERLVNKELHTAQPN